MKLGFACKYFDAQAKQPFPFKITTRTRFLSLDREEQARLLAQLATKNLENQLLTLQKLAKLPDAHAGPKGISLFVVHKELVNHDGSLGASNEVICG